MRIKIVYTIAAQAFRGAFRNKAVLWLTALLGVLLLMATYTGWKQYTQQTAIRQAYQKEVREQWLGNPDKHPHRMAHYGYFAFRPKHPLFFFDFGMDSYTGVSVFLEAHKQNSVNFSEASFSTGLLRFGEICMAMVLQLLVPLLTVFLGFSAVSALRENGTLKIVLSQGVSWQELLLGNTLGIGAVAAVLYLPVMLVTILFWAGLSSLTVSGDEWFRLAVLLLAYFAYLLIWALIAVLVSAFSKTSKGSLVTLIGVWLLCTIVLPRATQALGAYLHPAPSKMAFLAAIEADLAKEGDSHNPDDPHYKFIKDSLLLAHKVATVQELPFNYSGFIMAEGEKISAQIYARHQRRLIHTYEQQNRFNRVTAFVNPYTAIKHLSMALAGTDFRAYMDFQDAAEAFRYNLAQQMNTLQIKYISNAKPGEKDKPHTLDRNHWAGLPDFAFTYQPGTTVLRREAISGVALMAWLLLPLLLLFTLTKRFKAL